MSLNAVTRLNGHKREAEWFPSIRRIEVERFSTRQAAVIAEHEAIRTERPQFNRTGPNRREPVHSERMHRLTALRVAREKRPGW
jgi:hypothetical protein